jgi:hypothetical protein
MDDMMRLLHASLIIVLCLRKVNEDKELHEVCGSWAELLDMQRKFFSVMMLPQFVAGPGSPCDGGLENED